MSDQSWNLKAKVSDLKFSVPVHVKPIRDKVLKFVEEECYDLEKRLRGNLNPQDILNLQQKAKAQGLWALGM